MSAIVQNFDGVSDRPLYDWVKTFSPPSENLRWVHTTDAFAIRDILLRRTLLPQKCPVFEIPLTYMFYGRPAYRFNNRDAMLSSFHAPAVIVFKDSVLNHAHKLFPFDTGAFSAGRYKKWMHERMQLDSFEYPLGDHGQGRHVSAFYGRNESYWDGNGRDLGAIAGEFEVEAIGSMITDTTTDDTADDRRLAIELIIHEAIPMTAEYVEAIYLPTSLVDAPYVQKFLQDTGLKANLYKASGNKPAIEYQALLESELEQFHKFVGAL